MCFPSATLTNIVFLILFSLIFSRNFIKFIFIFSNVFSGFLLGYASVFERDYLLDSDTLMILVLLFLKIYLFHIVQVVPTLFYPFIIIFFFVNVGLFLILLIFWKFSTLFFLVVLMIIRTSPMFIIITIQMKIS